MTLLTIRVIPDPVLREKAHEVASVDKEVVRLMDDMLETMYDNSGIGLAANQVGILKRVIVLDISESRNGTEAMFMANPVVIWSSDEEFKYCEGCLSVPDQRADVIRPRKIRVQYLDKKGKQQELEAEDLLSQCIQHEIDHLNGVLFIDHLSRLKRSMIERKLEKANRYKDT